MARSPQLAPAVGVQSCYKVFSCTQCVQGELLVCVCLTLRERGWALRKPHCAGTLSRHLQLAPRSVKSPMPVPADLLGSGWHSLVLGNRLTSCLLSFDLQLLPVWQEAGSRGLPAVKTVCPSGSPSCREPLCGSSGALSRLVLASACLLCTGPSGGCRLSCCHCQALPPPPHHKLAAWGRVSCCLAQQVPGSCRAPTLLTSALLQKGPCQAWGSSPTKD